MKILYLAMLVILASCNKKKLFFIDQDNYNDYNTLLNSKLIIPKTFDLVRPKKLQSDKNNSFNNNQKLLPIEESIIHQTNNFNKEKIIKKDLTKTPNKLERIF